MTTTDRLELVLKLRDARDRCCCRREELSEQRRYVEDCLRDVRDQLDEIESDDARAAVNLLLGAVRDLLSDINRQRTEVLSTGDYDELQHALALQ